VDDTVMGMGLSREATKAIHCTGKTKKLQVIFTHFGAYKKLIRIKRACMAGFDAETKRFELLIQFPVYTLSRRAP
jgi:hypothetical protein